MAHVSEAATTSKALSTGQLLGLAVASAMLGLAAASALLGLAAAW